MRLAITGRISCAFSLTDRIIYTFRLSNVARLKLDEASPAMLEQVSHLRLTSESTRGGWFPHRDDHPSVLGLVRRGVVWSHKLGSASADGLEGAQLECRAGGNDRVRCK